MMMFGSGAVSVWSAGASGACSRLVEVTATAVPAGHPGPGVGPAISGGGRRGACGHVFPPCEDRPVDPDAVKDHGQRPGHRDLGRLHAVAPGKAQAPGRQRAPSPGPMQQDAGRRDQICAQRAVTPSRHAAGRVGFAGPLSARDQAETGADPRRILEARGIVDPVTEGGRRSPAPSSDGAGCRLPRRVDGPCDRARPARDRHVRGESSSTGHGTCPSPDSASTRRRNGPPIAREKTRPHSFRMARIWFSRSRRAAPGATA